MRISFFGSSLVSAYWNGAATYYRGVIRSLAELGYEITFYEPDAFERQQHRDMPDPDWAKVVVYPATEEGVNRALDAAGDADVTVKASGVGVFDAYLEGAVIERRRTGSAAIYWDVDAPATLDRMENDPGDPLRPLIPRFDMVLTYGGGPPVVEAFRRRGARDCVPIYNALDPETHHPVEPREEFAADLAFLGNRLPDREARVEEFFLDAAARLPERSFLIGGNGWEDKPMPQNVRRLGHVYTADHNALNCSARSVLNISRSSMASYGYSPATRVFEAAGAGACMITDFWEGIGEFFEPEKEILVAESGEAVAARLEALTPERSQAIGKAALRRVLAEHTYAHRAVQVDALLQGTDRAKASGGER